jgi:hypothetical protein
MTDPEILALASAISDELERRFRRQARALVDSDKATAEALAKALGAIEARDTDAAARRSQEMATLAGILARLDVLVGPARGEPEPQPPAPTPEHPKTTAAVDELGAASVGALTRWVHGLGSLPARTLDSIARGWTASWAFARAHPVLAFTIASAALPGLLRLLAAWVPGAEPLAELLQSVMDRVAPLVADGGSGESVP